MTNTTTTTTKLGRTGPDVFPIALGCMGMSGVYGAADEAESLATIQEALDRGITLLDTGDFYGMGHNELLLREAVLRKQPGHLVGQAEFRQPDRGMSSIGG